MEEPGVESWCWRHVIAEGDFLLGPGEKALRVEKRETECILGAARSRFTSSAMERKLYANWPQGNEQTKHPKRKEPSIVLEKGPCWSSWQSSWQAGELGT